jgi:hypothetical protein
MRKRVLAGLLGAAVVGTSLFPPLGTVPSALANKPIFLCIDPEIEPPSPNIFNSAKDARAFAKDNAGVVCSALHDH